jgi:exosortase
VIPLLGNPICRLAASWRLDRLTTWRGPDIVRGTPCKNSHARSVILARLFGMTPRTSGQPALFGLLSDGGPSGMTEVTPLFEVGHEPTYVRPETEKIFVGDRLADLFACVTACQTFLLFQHSASWESPDFMSGISNLTDRQREQTTIWCVFGLLVVALLWGYFNSLVRMSGAWSNPQYSHGWLVPLFAAVLFWLRREPFSAVPVAARWAGVGVLSVGLLMRLFGSFCSYNTIDNISLVPCLLGAVLIVGGWRMFRWAGPAVGFLIFMYPLPMGLERTVLYKGQQIAISGSTFALQTLGVDAFRTGTRISLAETDLNVIDACSGLRMSTIFLALAIAMAIITVRPWWERLIIVVSAIPIALIVNVIRITTTGMIYMWYPSLMDGDAVHNIGGFVMMPMALGLLYLESTLLSRLFVSDEGSVRVRPVGVGQRQARYGGA